MHQVLLPSSRIARFLNARKHPDQAALAARLPLIGRRVPMRGFWRRQPIEPARAVRHAVAPAFDAARHSPAIAAGAASLTAFGRGAEGMRQRAAASARALPRPHLPAMRGAMPALLAGAAAGALAMYYLDPQHGRRRRALVRDKLAHLRHVVTQEVPQTVERRGRFFRGVAKGVRHEAAGLVLHDGHRPAVDNETLVARVRSEVLRDGRIKAGEIHVDAYEGCVTLRGQLEHLEEIHRLVDATKHVDGVREVRSYLHLPGTLPPNKAEVYLKEAAPVTG